MAMQDWSSAEPHPLQLLPALSCVPGVRSLQMRLAGSRLQVRVTCHRDSSTDEVVLPVLRMLEPALERCAGIIAVSVQAMRG